MPSQLSNKLDWDLANPIWASTLNPLIANPLNYVSILTNQSLVAGVNVINHALGRNMLGWFLTDIQGAATIYRSAPMNKAALVLTSSAPVICNIGVF